MDRDRKGDARPDEIREFRDKGGAAVGRKDTVVEGDLDRMSANSRKSPGAAPEVREKLDEKAKRLP
jgi:hypothetical protein